MKSLFGMLAVVAALVSNEVVRANPMQNEIQLRVSRSWQSEGSTATHSFDRPTYVERLLVSAEGYRNYTTIDVYADSDRVAVLGVPGRDPDFPIVIRKMVSNIHFRFNGSAKINDARAWVDAGGYQPTPGFGLDYYRSPRPLNTNEQIAGAVLAVVAQLQINIPDGDFRMYLLPLRSAAIRLSASAGARSPLSNRTQSKASVLKAAITAAEPFLQKLEGNPIYVNAIELLLEVKERIESNY
ncbi:MAG: hypothetical protein AB7F59_04745 [Bdellovibrionales bacterium]